MQDSTLRVILFIVILAFGTLMLLVDVPFFYLLLGAVALAFLVLFLTGTIKLPASKRRKKPAPASQGSAKEKGENESKGKKDKKPKSGREKRKSPEIFSSLKKALAVIGNDLKRARLSRKGEGNRAKKIDTLLDRTVSGEEVVSLDDIVPEAVPAERKKGDDPFTALVGEDLNPDLLGEIEPDIEFSIPADEDLGIEIPTQKVTSPDGSVFHMDLSLASDEAPIAIDETNDADEVREILEAHKDEISITPDMEVPLSEVDLGGIDTLDLEGIEIEGESAGPQQPATATPAKGFAQAGEAGMAPIPSKPAAPEQKASPSVSQPEAEMLSFGTGKREDDDLMASLKAESKVKKKSEYASLVRDLKDVRVSASDLQKELEELLKPRKTRTQ